MPELQLVVDEFRQLPEMELFAGVPDLCSRAQFAATLGITCRTLDRLIKGGKVKAVRIGRQVRIPKTELVRIVREGGTDAR